MSKLREIILEGFYSTSLPRTQMRLVTKHKYLESKLISTLNEEQKALYQEICRTADMCEADYDTILADYIIKYMKSITIFPKQ